MIWRSVSELEDMKAIDNFEKENGLTLPESYKKIVSQYNGGYPASNSIRLTEKEETDIKLFLSYNSGDIETVYTAFPFFSERGLIPFATDSAGNYFCFDNEKVVFWEHEEDQIISVANNFPAFMDKLGADSDSGTEDSPAMTIEDAFMKNEEERRFYELSEKGRPDYENAIFTAERQGKLEVARSMSADAMSPDLIFKYTGLTIEEIEVLS